MVDYHLPPGPCGVCGAVDSVCVTVTDDTDDPEEMPYISWAHCEECGIGGGWRTSPETVEVVEVWGGRPGYAAGIAGPRLAAAVAAAGWRQFRPFGRLGDASAW